MVGKRESTLRAVSLASLRVSKLPRVTRRGMRTHAQGRRPCAGSMTEGTTASAQGAIVAPRALAGDPYGNRTHVFAVRGRCLSLLTNGPLFAER